MPVTIKVSNHLGRPWIDPPPVISTEQLLERSCSATDCKNVIQSSFDDFSNTLTCGSNNGFVRACYHAYSNHHHLTLRPEDVWFAILTQLSFYINSHAEELRSFFVIHEGREELEVIEGGTINTVDFGPLAVRMTKEMDKHVIDPDLRQWVMPDFTTTTKTDTVTAAVLMMGAMQEYFSYKMTLDCGIPSVTLLGGRDDWVKIQDRLDKLPQLGEEPTEFARLLRPVLAHFIRCFESPKSRGARSFWTKVAHENGGSGAHFLSGWITAFCFWSAKGQCLYSAPTGVNDTNSWDPSYRTSRGCDIDGTLYHRVDTNDIPDGYVSLPVTVDDNGHTYKCSMVAGLVGIQLSSSRLPVDENKANIYGPSFGWGIDGNTTYSGGGRYPTNLDQIQPVSGWWIYEIHDKVKGEKHPFASVNDINSQRTQKSSREEKKQRSSMYGKAKESWLGRQLRSLVSYST
ncbi:MAG: hypothetical protein Q9219_007563 [cf. Caloplaca sp. 3 TL-2023]